MWTENITSEEGQGLSLEISLPKEGKDESMYLFKILNAGKNDVDMGKLEIRMWYECPGKENKEKLKINSVHKYPKEEDLIKFTTLLSTNDSRCLKIGFDTEAGTLENSNGSAEVYVVFEFNAEEDSEILSFEKISDCIKWSQEAIYYNGKIVYGEEPATLTPTVTCSLTFTITETGTITKTETETETITNTDTISPTCSDTPTVTETPSITETATITQTATITATATDTGTFTETPTITEIFIITQTHTITQTYMISQTVTPTLTTILTFTSTTTMSENDAEEYSLTPVFFESSTPTQTPSQDPLLISSLKSVIGENIKGFSKNSVYTFPNPASGPVTIRFGLEKTQEVKLTIYSLDGKMVWKNNISATETDCGVNYVQWDCRNNDGVEAANGVYLVEICLIEKCVRKKIAIVK